MIKSVFTVVASVAALALAAPANAETYVIGDSIAVGIATANRLDKSGYNVWRKGGQDTTVVLSYIRRFIATGKARGSTVILSSGASNSTYERQSGPGRDLAIAPVQQEIRLLREAGAKVFLVGTGSEHSVWITNRYGQYRVNFRNQRVNQRLEEAAKKEGAFFLGPLEQYAPDLNRHDGIHPGFQASRAIYKVVQKNNG